MAVLFILLVVLTRRVEPDGESTQARFLQKDSTIYDDSEHHHNLLNRTFAESVRILDDAGIPYFAHLGTALAIQRDGHFERVNDDIDIAFDLDYSEQLTSAFRKAGFVVEAGPEDWGCRQRSINYCKELLFVHKPGEVPEGPGR